MAMDLVNMMAVRNSIQRMPCRPDDDDYRRFEESFFYEPTPDQRQCFDVRSLDKDRCYIDLYPDSIPDRLNDCLCAASSRRHDQQFSSDGPVDLRGRGLREDRGRDPGHLQSGPVRQAGESRSDTAYFRPSI